MKTYPHNVEEQVRLSDERRAQAAKVDPARGLCWFAEYNLLQLQHIGERGLPTCYEEAEEFLYDFFPDLPWNLPDQQAVVRLMLADARWPATHAAVKETTGLDMTVELKKALEDTE
jgi:hypothetical protein